MSINVNKHLLLGCLVVSITLEGCATSNKSAYQDDQWQGWNRNIQSFNDTLDKAVLKPLAQGYQWATPDIVDQGVSNFFSNIDDINVTINDFLQFKMMQGGMDASRFLVNTTAGIGGIIDVADMIDLPKHNEDFGQTLGAWGVPSGSYLVLPFLGASSPRDTAGLLGDALLNPLTYVSIFGGTAVNAATAGSRVIDVTDTRADLLTTEKIVDEASVDRYDFIKNAYKQRRQYLINDGNSPEEEDFELDENDLSEDKTDGSKTDGTNSNQQPENPKHFLDLSAP
ncbi:MAG: MlaA family lipoprotein [Methylovulum sp.]